MEIDNFRGNLNYVSAKIVPLMNTRMMYWMHWLRQLENLDLKRQRINHKCVLDHSCISSSEVFFKIKYIYFSDTLMQNKIN